MLCLPYAGFLSLTDDIFVTCHLKVIKNNTNTYDNMHFEKKLPKKVLSAYFRLYPYSIMKCSSSVVTRAICLDGSAPC